MGQTFSITMPGLVWLGLCTLPEDKKFDVFCSFFCPSRFWKVYERHITMKELELIKSWYHWIAEGL